VSNVILPRHFPERANMKILIVGQGGREHALAWKISKSPMVQKVYCLPGNAGTASLGENIHVSVEDIKGIVEQSKKLAVDLVVVGPEAPLVDGLANSLSESGILCFGPDRRAAMIEGSKWYAKDLMSHAGVPTARWESFDDSEKAHLAVERFGIPVVIKADGLAAGKGVIVCKTLLEAHEAVTKIMEQKEFGAAGDKVIIEEFMEGEEASFIALVDGETVLPLASSQDHKRVFDNDEGPNTGGMGAYSPAPVVDDALHEEIIQKIMKPIVSTMEKIGSIYQGALYAGLMICRDGPKVLEFNARFGDPETQPLVVRMDGDIVPLLLACANRTLAKQKISWKDQAAVCIVMASRGYPGKYEKGKTISGIFQAEQLDSVSIFQSGTAFGPSGEIVSNGGRVLGVTGLGNGIRNAIEHTYKAVSVIHFDGAHFRRDIGKRALDRNHVE